MLVCLACWSHKLMLSVILYCSPAYMLQQGISLSLELRISSRLAGRLINAWDLAVSPVQHWGSRLALTHLGFMWVLKGWSQLFMLGKQACHSLSYIPAYLWPSDSYLWRCTGSSPPPTPDPIDMLVSTCFTFLFQLHTVNKCPFHVLCWSVFLILFVLLLIVLLKIYASHTTKSPPNACKLWKAVMLP